MQQYAGVRHAPRKLEEPLTDKEKEPLPKEKDNGIIGGVIAGVAALGAGGYYVCYRG
jgi:hypothetical protein